MKKRTNPANRYNGFNAYGQRCEVHTVKLNPKTALEQCLKIVEKVEIAQAEGRRLEYTLDWSTVPQEETLRINEILDRRAKLRGYLTGSFRIKN
jgi:hypothetical protein